MRSLAHTCTHQLAPVMSNNTSISPGGQFLLGPLLSVEERIASVSLVQRQTCLAEIHRQLHYSLQRLGTPQHLRAFVKSRAQPPNAESPAAAAAALERQYTVIVRDAMDAVKVVYDAALATAQSVPNQVASDPAQSAAPPVAADAESAMTDVPPPAAADAPPV